MRKIQKLKPHKSQYFIGIGILLISFFAWALQDVQVFLNEGIVKWDQSIPMFTSLELSEQEQQREVDSSSVQNHSLTHKLPWESPLNGLGFFFQSSSLIQNTPNLPFARFEGIEVNLAQDSSCLADLINRADPATDLVDPDFNIEYNMPVRPEMKVYLTFDDGPTEYTEKILNTLDEHDAVATFFMLEPHIRLYPDLVRRMEKEGHALGSHGVTHKRHIFYKSTESMISEMDQTIAAIRDVTGVGSSLVRVPYGSVPHLSQNQMKILNDHGYKIWDWNVDSSDWRTQDARYVATTIKQVQKLREQETSPIILLHDMKGTAEHLSDLLEYLKQSGYVFCILDPSLPEYHIGSS